MLGRDNTSQPIFALIVEKLGFRGSVVGVETDGRLAIAVLAHGAHTTPWRSARDLSKSHTWVVLARSHLQECLRHRVSEI